MGHLNPSQISILQSALSLLDKPGVVEVSMLCDMPTRLGVVSDDGTGPRTAAVETSKPSRPALVTDYLSCVLDRTARTELISKLIAYLRPKSYLFDAIAFRGMSGALIGPTLADQLNKQIIMVRKPDTDGHSHSYLLVEGQKSHSYIIVDDFVSSGDTVKAIVAALEQEKFTTAKPVAIMCYTDIGQTHKDVGGIPIWRL